MQVGIGDFAQKSFFFSVDFALPTDLPTYGVFGYKGKEKERVKERENERTKKRNKPNRATMRPDRVTMCDFQTSLMDGRTDGRTDPLIEMRGRT